MKYYVVIPAHNEEATLGITLESLLNQSHLPSRIVVVDDNSTDGTSALINSFSRRNPLIEHVKKESHAVHVPGSKVVQAFNAGVAILDKHFDFLVKLDADLVLPTDYFKRIADHFSKNPSCGLAGGFAYERSADGKWELNHPMHKEHVRGGFKAYTRSCFDAIGGLRKAIGWDTADELLARYHGFEVHTLPELNVLHLRPTGRSYKAGSTVLQGEAFYRMRYGILISAIATLKMAWKKRDLRVISDNYKGYWQAASKKLPRIVSTQEGKFIRRYRWKRMAKNLF